MVELLRAGGGTGFLHGVGMFMTKHHAVVLGDRPRDGGFAGGGDVPTLPGVDVVDDYEGPGTIETYAVMYGRDGVRRAGCRIGRGGGGERFVARVRGRSTPRPPLRWSRAGSSRSGLPGRSGSATM